MSESKTYIALLSESDPVFLSFLEAGARATHPGLAQYLANKGKKLRGETLSAFTNNKTNHLILIEEGARSVHPNLPKYLAEKGREASAQYLATVKISNSNKEPELVDGTGRQTLRSKRILNRLKPIKETLDTVSEMWELFELFSFLTRSFLGLFKFLP